MVRIARVVLLKGKGKNKCVLSVANMEFPEEDRWYGLPGGTVWVGERVVHGAQRETKEETGYTPGCLEEVLTEKQGKIYHHYFRAKKRRGKRKTEPTRGADGHIEDGPPEWILLSDIADGNVVFHPRHRNALEKIGIL